MKAIKHLGLSATLGMSILLLLLIPTAAQDVTPTPIPLQAGTIVVLADGNVWTLNPQTWERTPYVGFSWDQFLRWQGLEHTYNIICDTECSFYGKNAYNTYLVERDLVTGEERILLERNNMWWTETYPDKLHLGVFYYLDEEMARNFRYRSTSVCILEIASGVCKEASKDFGSFLDDGEKYWLDNERFFIAGPYSFWLVNAYTQEYQELYPDVGGWGPISSALFPDLSKLLITANLHKREGLNAPNDLLTLDLNTLEITELPYDTIPTYGHGRLRLSPNEKYLLYRTPHGHELINFETGESIASGILFLTEETWTPDSRNILGAIYGRGGRKESAIRIDAETGEIHHLFDVESNVYFLIVK